MQGPLQYGGPARPPTSPRQVRGKIAPGPRLDREASSAGHAADFSQPAARPRNLVLQPPATGPP